MGQEKIRNFCIIAHIDSGKSTLADRMLEITGTVSKEKMRPQMLDMLDLERERGITIKLQPVRMEFEIRNPKSAFRHAIRNGSTSLTILSLSKDKSQILNSKNQNSKDSNSLEFRVSNLEFANSKQEFVLNLIDTPGHVDFSYEVSRSLMAVEGAILLVDATKGIQAQTLANLHLAQEHNLKIIPVINKIDLPNAEVGKVAEELADLLEIDKNEILKVSAKTGEGMKELLHEITRRVPAPVGDEKGEFKALIFDSVYDSFRGVIAFVRVFEGQVKKGTKILFLSTKKCEEVVEVGEFKLQYQPKNSLEAGEIGYLVTGAKDIAEVQVGDTIVLDSPLEVSPIVGFRKPQPMVFASFFVRDGDINLLREALKKLKLNDSSLVFEPENSEAFGHGFRCGFLGLLHLDITKVRLEREYNLDLIVTQPSVLYKIHHAGTKEEYEEPWVDLEIITPKDYLGPIMELAQNRRGVYKDTKFISNSAILFYEIPLAEIIIDFYDKLKSVSKGYASQNYEIIGWRPGDLVKLTCLIAGERIEEFSLIVPRSRSQIEAKKLALKLKNLIPRQMFEVSVQVAQAGKILARENISALKKDVTAKLYGGDVTRKNKLLKKQAKGKKKMKMLGKVEIPSNVFIDILKS